MGIYADGSVAGKAMAVTVSQNDYRQSLLEPLWTKSKEKSAGQFNRVLFMFEN